MLGLEADFHHVKGRDDEDGFCDARPQPRQQAPRGGQFPCVSAAGRKEMEGKGRKEEGREGGVKSPSYTTVAQNGRIY